MRAYEAVVTRWRARTAAANVETFDELCLRSAHSAGCFCTLLVLEGKSPPLAHVSADFCKGSHPFYTHVHERAAPISSLVKFAPVLRSTSATSVRSRQSYDLFSVFFFCLAHLLVRAVQRHVQGSELAKRIFKGLRVVHSVAASRIYAMIIALLQGMTPVLVSLLRGVYVRLHRWTDEIK